MIRQQIKSKTMITMFASAFVQSSATILTFLVPVLTEKEFAIVSALVAFGTAIAGMVLRQLTTQAIKDK